MGILHTIDANETIDAIFLKISKLLKPNLIFLYG